MKTIEDRAKKFADEFTNGDAALIVDIIHKVAEESYIKGATEQQEIDSVINEEELDRLANEEYPKGVGVFTPEGADQRVLNSYKRHTRKVIVKRKESDYG